MSKYKKPGGKRNDEVRKDHFGSHIYILVFQLYGKI